MLNVLSTLKRIVESELHPEMPSNSNITVHPLSPIPKFLKTNKQQWFLIFGPLKVIFQIWSLWLVLGYRTSPAKWMLIQVGDEHCGFEPAVPGAPALTSNERQNPPSIPSLLIAQVICFLRNTNLIVDWHNFGYSILALKLGVKHPLVRISKFYEELCSRSATAHFTVTEAMGRALKKDYKITGPVITLHDRPTSQFRVLDELERSKFLMRLQETASHVDEIKRGSCKLIVSSTSWTPDEDFPLLLEALVNYSGLAKKSSSHLPKILAIITGKGPQKAEILIKIEALKSQNKLSMVCIKTAWLSLEDYAKLLGAADLGICLHTSSSGVDLPMKVVDMFGTGLPVVGWGVYESWPELVSEGINGRGFGSAAELNAILAELLGSDKSKMQKLRAGAIEEGKWRWDDEWDLRAGKLLELS